MEVRIVFLPSHRGDKRHSSQGQAVQSIRPVFQAVRILGYPVIIVLPLKTNEYKQSVVVIWQSPPADTPLSTYENQLAYLTRLGRSAGQERLRLDLLRLRVGDQMRARIRPAPTPGIRSISTGRLWQPKVPLASRHQESARWAATAMVRGPVGGQHPTELGPQCQRISDALYC